jgi:hypothetical protein
MGATVEFTKVNCPDQPDAVPEAHPADARVEVLADLGDSNSTASACPLGPLALRATQGCNRRMDAKSPHHPAYGALHFASGATAPHPLGLTTFPIPATRRAAQEERCPMAAALETPAQPGVGLQRPKSAGRITEKVFQDFFGRRGWIHDSPGKVGDFGTNAQAALRMWFFAEWHRPARRG